MINHSKFKLKKIMKVWLIVLLVLGGVIAGGGIAFGVLVFLKKRREKQMQNIQSALMELAPPEYTADKNIPLKDQCCVVNGKKIAIRCRTSCEDQGFEPTTCDGDVHWKDAPWDCRSSTSFPS